MLASPALFFRPDFVLRVLAASRGRGQATLLVRAGEQPEMVAAED
jgi:hypothetical protein